MSDGRQVLRAVKWRELFPWLIIYRTFRLAIRPSLLTLATVAALLVPAGWRVADYVFGRYVAEDAQFEEVARYNNRWPGEQTAAVYDSEAPNTYTAGGYFQFVYAAPSQAADAFESISLPFRNLFQSQGLTWAKVGYYLSGGLWTLLIWSLFGGAITRIAAVHLGREEKVSLVESVIFAARRLHHYFLAPLLPFLFVLIIVLLSQIVGLLMRADVLLPAAGALWVFVLLGSLVMAVILTGLLLGWPLMWPAISAEASDSFDALSRSYAYTYQRPLHYLFYAIVAALFGVLCWYVVWLFTEAVVDLAWWAVSWTASQEQVARIRAVDESGGGALHFGAVLTRLGDGLVRSVAAGFRFSFFWCAATAVYLLLRRDVDHAEFDEIELNDAAARPLPPLEKDEAGVPRAPKEFSPEDKEPPPETGGPSTAEESSIP